MRLGNIFFLSILIIVVLNVTYSAVMHYLADKKWQSIAQYEVAGRINASADQSLELVKRCDSTSNAMLEFKAIGSDEVVIRCYPNFDWGMGHYTRYDLIKVDPNDHPILTSIIKVMKR
ncbi:hypothetical protein [Photobacterium leiognathi]|uniref:hypothetical protein n=1 Tax=Photobacterium leiognathi TaxID=553611 RepID=UPI0029826571|nr:hypothetical protein [Photobacterium leiognathi]